MRLYKDSEIVYWLNYFAELIKDDIESKGGICKIQLSFTGNLLFIRGYCSIDNYYPETVLDEIIETNKTILEIFGPGIRNHMVYIDKTPHGVKRNLCHSYYRNDLSRPIINDLECLSENIIKFSESPFGYSINYKTPIYYGEYIAKDLLRFTKSDMVHIDFTEPEDLSLSLKSIYPKKSIESCVLDIYDFDFNKFQKLLKGYDFKQEILEPLGKKPWLKDSKLKEYIIF